MLKITVSQAVLSSGLERLLKGEHWWKVCDGWLREDNPTTTIPPWGLAVQTALHTANTYQTLNNFIESYSSLEQRQISSLDSNLTVSRPSVDIVEEASSTVHPPLLSICLGQS